MSTENMGINSYRFQPQDSAGTNSTKGAEGGSSPSGGTTPGALLLALAQAISANSEVQLTLNKLQNTLQKVKFNLATAAANKQFIADTISGAGSIAQGAVGMAGAYKSGEHLNEMKNLQAERAVPAVDDAVGGMNAELEEVPADALENNVLAADEEVNAADVDAAVQMELEENAADVDALRDNRVAGNGQGAGGQRVLSEKEIDDKMAILERKGRIIDAKFNSASAATKGILEVGAAIQKEKVALTQAAEQRTDAASRSTESTSSAISSFLQSVAGLAGAVTQRQIAKAGR